MDLVVDDDGTAAAAIATAGAGGASDEVESELRCADGSVRAFLWTAVPVADVTGRTQALVLVSGIEVTERRRLEVEKERERAFLNAIANNAPSMLCLIDADGRLTQGGGNIAFEHTLGYAPTEIGGQVLWEDFVDPAEADEVRALVEAVAAGELPKEHDNTWVTNDGRRLSVAWTCTPLPEIDERRLLLITGVDITERKRTAEHLHASSARLVGPRIAHGVCSSATSTTARSSGSWLSRSRCGSSSRSSRPTPPRRPAARRRARGADARARGAARARPRDPSRRSHGPRPAPRARDARVANARPGGVVAPERALRAGGRGRRVLRVAETLTNVAKYARATSARVEVAQSNGSLRRARVRRRRRRRRPRAGSGLRGLADRVAVLDGTLEVVSPTGGGTAIRAEIPLAEETVEIHSGP